ncbi:class IIb bacteriocin, lactobin A/cerein 7B family [Rhodocytophaga rosea]|uniref:Class IIb bacteriocin, lactobin A/cerein 7B family n=1 Tax=Rhodocytophaga rosea TaxID=2704465 RepID=A0A6C0GSF6_9BACT|nr:class IIb bacteriocin, lactobin A/cerein 7B family [Rhodocytophaga rosea]QHT65261.1 class IIb bacteriocin, lactobin A/cerein 7B family [Rhodocytophaga rosea]QHT70887.1 class IIb bacteriocin, lactobin A/cerein 7B family [Rhodocytophaga rosea]
MENLNQIGLVELNSNELQEIEGGLIPLIIALAAFDACLWGYIALN